MLIYMSLNSNILTHIALVPTISTNGWKSMVSGSQIRPTPKVRIMQITPYEYVSIILCFSCRVRSWNNCLRYTPLKKCS